jgi:hypothetical protein
MWWNKKLPDLSPISPQRLIALKETLGCKSRSGDFFRDCWPVYHIVLISHSFVLLEFSKMISLGAMTRTMRRVLGAPSVDSKTTCNYFNQHVNRLRCARNQARTRNTSGNCNCVDFSYCPATIITSFGTCFIPIPYAMPNNNLMNACYASMYCNR